MTPPEVRDVRTDGLTPRCLIAGEGPLVLFLHGFPELAISWTAQIEAFAAAGFRAVALDMRGYGGTGGPEGPEHHTILHLVGDVVDLVRALGEETAVVVGHDWGAAVAWQCALMRPDLFRAVAGLSVPFQPRRAAGPPTRVMRAMSAAMGEGDLYILRLIEAGSELELDADPRQALLKMFWSYDGATAVADRSTGFIPPGQTLLSAISDSAALPPWLPEDHFDTYVAAFEAGGFGRPMDWYRAIDRNWALTAFVQDRRIEQPSLFITGESDPVRRYAGRQEAGQAEWLTDLRGAHVLKGAGHWIQQERAGEVTRLLMDFAAGL